MSPNQNNSVTDIKPIPNGQSQNKDRVFQDAKNVRPAARGVEQSKVKKLSPHAVSRDSKEYLVDNLSMLIASGVSVGEALDTIGKEMPSKKVRAVIAEMRNKGFSLEWDVYYPIDAQFNVMASFGFITMHPNLEINATSSTNLGSALNKVKGRNKTIFRPGLGVEYLEKNWGARGRLLWDDTQKLYLNTDRVGATFFNALTPKAFKQTMTFTFGVFYRF